MARIIVMDQECRARSEPIGFSSLDDRLDRIEADRSEGVVGPEGEGDPLRAGA